MATNPPIETFTAEQFLAVANGQQIQTETAIAMLRYAATLAREVETLKAALAKALEAGKSDYMRSLEENVKRHGGKLPEDFHGPGSDW